jgi:hypothetical protein
MPIVASRCTIPGYITNGTCYVWSVVYDAGTAHLDVTTLWSARTFGRIYPPLDIYTGDWVLTANGTEYAAWVVGSPAVSGAFHTLAVVYAEPPLYNITIYRYHTNLMDVLGLYGPQLVGLSYAYPAYQTTPYGLYDVSIPPVYANGVISAKVQTLPANQESQEEDVAVVLTRPPPSIYAPSTS